jgi:hypothetical protein
LLQHPVMAFNNAFVFCENGMPCNKLNAVRQRKLKNTQKNKEDLSIRVFQFSMESIQPFAHSNLKSSFPIFSPFDNFFPKT